MTQEVDYLKLEQDFREYMSFKNTDYMTSGSAIDLNLLAALVDNRYKGREEEKYSTYTMEVALPLIQEKLNETQWRKK